MTPTPEQPQQKFEDYLKSCNDREYAEYIIATMTHGNSPSDFDKIQKEAIQAIRSRAHTSAPAPAYPESIKKCDPQQYNAYLAAVRDKKSYDAAIARKAREDVLEDLCKLCIKDESVGCTVFRHIQSLRQQAGEQ